MSRVSLLLSLTESALKLREALPMHSDVAARLRDTVNDAHRGTPNYGYYIDHDGDGTEGNCIYNCNGDIRSAPYEIGTQGGKAFAHIDMGNSKNVVPMTTYTEEPDGDEDSYNAMDEAKRPIYLAAPIYERFISTKTRKAADASSFAGKGRSFPILKSEDVSAALHSLGRAGPGNYSTDTIRANIKRIAKAKGFALPDSLKDSVSTWRPEGVLLLESCATFIEQPRLQEAATADYPIKLISPGRGSSGYYTPEVLKNAAESKVFKAGTHMFWNHDTDAEESARPEGDLNRLAAVTTTDASWQEKGHDGPGLYARAKVFGDYADKVKEMGPHIGLSIRAGGDRDESAKAPDGKPRVITALKNAASVDFVTKAGRDGKIFTESRTEGDKDMTEAEVKALLKESIAPLEAENKRLKEALLMQEAPQKILTHLRDIRLPDAGKKLVVERVVTQLGGNMPTDEKLKALVESEAAGVARMLTELGYSSAGLGKRMTEAETQQFTEADSTKLHEVFEETMGKAADIFVGPKLPKTDDPQGKIAREARKRARKAFMEGRAA